MKNQKVPTFSESTAKGANFSIPKGAKKLFGSIDWKMLNQLKNNNIEWITLLQGAKLLGVSKESLRQRCQKNEFVTRDATLNGGRGREISTQHIFFIINDLRLSEKVQESEEVPNLGTLSSAKSSALSKCNKKQDDNEPKIWIDLSESSALFQAVFGSGNRKSLSERAKNGEFIYDWQTGVGGKKMVLDLASLPVQVRNQYWQNNKPALDRAVDADMEAIAAAPEYNRRKAYKYLVVIRASEGLKGTALKSFLKEWNKTNEKDLRISYDRLLKVKKQYLNGGVAALLGGYGKRAGDTMVDEDCFNYFTEHYLVERGPSQAEVWLETKGYAQRVLGLDVEDFPTVRAFIYQLKKRIPADAIDRARYGEAYWNKKHGYYVHRTMNMKAGAVWFSDHRQLDNLVFPDAVPSMARRELRAFLKKNPSKKPGRPWITVWRDMRTGLWLGWSIHFEAPNSDHILQALYNAMIRYGVPEYLYIDNGKDYKARHFSGGRYFHKLHVDEKRVTSLTVVLGIQVIFCWPFNPQAKTLERDFRDKSGGFDKRIRGYIGHNTVSKPESTKKQIESGNIMVYDEYEALLNDYIKHVINQRQSFGQTLQGRSRAQAWNEEFEGLRAVHADDLKLLCMAPSEAKMIGRNGFLDAHMDMWYYADWMSGMKRRRVYMRRDPHQYQIGWFFDDDTDEYIGAAELQLPVPGLAVSDIEKDKVRRAIRERQTAAKIAKAYAEDRQADEVEQFSNLIAGIGPGEEPKKNAGNIHILPQLRKAANDDLDFGDNEDKPRRGTVAAFEFENNTED